jgi:hypothetical protein
LNIAVLILGLTGIASLSALGKLKSKISESSTFRIVHDRKSIPILYDRDDADVVCISAKALVNDIKLITNISPGLETHLTPETHSAIIVGTLGKIETHRYHGHNRKTFSGYHKRKVGEFSYEDCG